MPVPDPPPSPLRTLDRDACLRLLSTRRVGRLAFNRRALPDVVPVNFVMDGDDLLIRLEAGSRIARAVTGAVVAFQVDEIHDDAKAGWSVTVVGEANEVIEPTPRQQAASERLTSWAGGHRDLLLRIMTERIGGRRLLPAPEAGAVSAG